MHANIAYDSHRKHRSLAVAKTWRLVQHNSFINKSTSNNIHVQLAMYIQVHVAGSQTTPVDLHHLQKHCIEYGMKQSAYT